MKAAVRTRFVNLDAGGNQDLLLLAALGIGAYYFLTRQIVPDAARAVVSAGGAVADGANAAANRAAQIIMGTPYASVGTAAYELTHPRDNAGAIAVAPSIPSKAPLIKMPSDAYDAGENLVNNPAVFGYPYTDTVPGTMYDADGNVVGGIIF